MEIKNILVEAQGLPLRVYMYDVRRITWNDLVVEWRYDVWVYKKTLI